MTAFLGPTGFERWLGALEFGALRLGCAAQADDLASGSGEVFKRTVHTPILIAICRY